MKSEEALKYLKDFIDNDPQIGAYNTSVLKKAVDALEYRVPKKPHKVHDVDEEGHPYYTYVVCDNCGNVIDEYEDYFCPNCGQAVDWDDMGCEEEQE